MVIHNSVIFDIDGTLADLSHRLHFVTGGKKDWPGFFAQMHLDQPHEAVIELSQCCRSKWYLVLVSGRPESHREVTETWLRSHNVSFDALYMRKTGDFRADVVIKRELLAQLRADSYHPRLVIDDRPQVVKMWREEGLVCLQAEYREFEAPKGQRLETLLTLLIGPTGAGKSTYASKTFPARQIISSDDVREDLLGNRHDQTQNEKVFGVLHALAKERLRLGLHTVIDATNLKRKDRLACANLTPPGALCNYIVLDRSLEQKLQTREWRSPELITKHQQTFNSQLKDILKGDGLSFVRVLDQRTTDAS